MSVQQEKFKAIADKIREKTGTTEPIIPNDFTNKIDEVYAAGEKHQYDELWDALQKNGDRTNYKNAFYGWSEDIFIPQYPLNIVGDMTGIFMDADFTDMKNHVTNHNITINTNQVTNFTNAFNGCLNLTSVPQLDFTNATVANYLFYKCGNLLEVGEIGGEKTTGYNSAFYGCKALKKIGLIHSLTNSTWTTAFLLCSALEDVEFVGVIGTDINFQYSTALKKESIMSIIKALSNNISSKTVTLSKTAVNAIDWSNTVIDGVTYNTWEEVIGARNNWTIGLV